MKNSTNFILLILYKVRVGGRNLIMFYWYSLRYAFSIIIIKPGLKQILRDFVSTSNSGKYETETELLSKFPKLKVYNIQTLRDFVATYNSGKYKTENEVFSKFPEFFDQKSIAEFNSLNSESSVHKLLNNSNFKNIFWVIAFILFSLLYPIRLIFLILKWSFKTLN